MTSQPRQLRKFIGGQYVDPEGDATTDIVDPSTAQVVAKAPVSTQSDVDRAYAAAAKALNMKEAALERKIKKWGWNETES